MNSIHMRRALLYIAFLGAMIFSGSQLGSPTTSKASGDSCCAYGNQCTTKAAPKCCNPSLGEAPCSETQRNYCRAGTC
jgi:hypothetical protein